MIQQSQNKQSQGGAVLGASLAAAIGATGPISHSGSSSYPLGYSIQPVLGNTNFAQRLEPTKMEREQIVDMIAASEARSDVKFERLMGEIRTSLAELKGEVRAESESIRAGQVGKFTLITTVVLTALATVAAVVATLAYGLEAFQAGQASQSNVPVDRSVATNQPEQENAR